MELLKWIQDWYSKLCGGEDACGIGLEHVYGISIETIDNPGWMVKIKLYCTRLEGKKFDAIKYDNGDNDWLICELKQDEFRGCGDLTKLIEILKVFKEWVEA